MRYASCWPDDESRRTVILDDFDSRPGSATSLLRTIVGACLRDLGGKVTVARLILLLGAVGVPEAQARTAVLRVKRKGILLPAVVDGQAGYRVSPDALPMLESGDRRIFSFRQMGDDDPWCLVSYSIPESMRAERHQLRRRLDWIGCGTVATGLWICPAFLADEADGILTDLGLREYATMFITSMPAPGHSIADAARRWWDLPRLETLHRDFLAATADFEQVGPSGAPGFSAWIHTLDEYRVIPYLDPGLPPAALPADWPGAESLARFNHLVARFAAPGLSFATR